MQRMEGEEMERRGRDGGRREEMEGEEMRWRRGRTIREEEGVLRW